MREPIPTSTELAARARALMDGGFSEAARHAARRVLIDTVGCMLAGASDPNLAALAANWGCDPAGGRAPVVGMAGGADASTATLIGGTAAVWHDYDCGDRFLGGHPAAHIVPAALALSATTRVSGRDLLAALVAGFEVAAAVRYAIGLHPTMHPHGTWPAVGAAAASALLLGLGTAELVNALEIAGSMSLATTFRSALAGATVRNLYAGTGAALGLLAAQASRGGMSGLADGMDDIYGTILAAGDAGDAGAADDRPYGEGLEIERSYFKAHACARYLHSALDALGVILGGHDVDAEGVHEVEVATYAFAASMDDPAPRSELAARFSLPYAIAALLVLGDTGIDAFGTQHLHTGALREMAARVAVHEDPRYTQATPSERPARVRLVTADGTYEAEVRLPRGEPDCDPLSDEDVSEKFMASAARVVPGERAAQVLGGLWDVESVPDVAEIVRFLVPPNV